MTDTCAKLKAGLVARFVVHASDVASSRTCRTLRHVLATRCIRFPFRETRCVRTTTSLRHVQGRSHETAVRASLHGSDEENQLRFIIRCSKRMTHTRDVHAYRPLKRAISIAGIYLKKERVVKLTRRFRVNKIKMNRTLQIVENPIVTQVKPRTSTTLWLTQS